MTGDIFAKYSENMRMVLRRIFEGGGMVRSALADAVGLSVITLAKYISEFISDGIVTESGSADSTGGRRPAILEINADCAHIVGVDIGAHSVKLGLVGLNGRILHKELITGDPEEKVFFDYPPAMLADRIAELVAGYPAGKLLAISIGISGLVDADKNSIVFCPNIRAWNNAGIIEMLSSKFGVPVFVDTSARCMIRAERRFGAVKDVKNAVYVSMGYGIAAGILANGQVYEGDGFAGEIGHIKVKEGPETLCTCGSFNCLELYATLPMINAEIAKRVFEQTGYSPAREILQNGLTQENYIKAVETGDKIALSVIDDITEMTGRALAVMTNILNPSVIILGGRVIEAMPMITDMVFRTIRQNSLLTSYRNLEVKKSSFGWEGGILGSAARVIDKVFYD